MDTVNRNKCTILCGMAYGLRIIATLREECYFVYQLMEKRKFFNSRHNGNNSLSFLQDVFQWVHHEKEFDTLKIKLMVKFKILAYYENIEMLIQLLCCWCVGLSARLILPIKLIAKITDNAAIANYLWFELQTETGRWVSIYRDAFDEKTEIVTKLTSNFCCMIILSFNTGNTITDETKCYKYFDIDKQQTFQQQQTLESLNCCNWLRNTIYTPTSDTATKNINFKVKMIIKSKLIRPDTKKPTFIFQRKNTASATTEPSNFYTILPRIWQDERTHYSNYQACMAMTTYEWLCRGMEVRKNQKPIAFWCGEQNPCNKTAFRRFHRLQGKVVTSNIVNTSASSSSTKEKATTCKKMTRFPLYGIWQTRRYENKDLYMDNTAASVTVMPMVMPIFHEIMVPNDTVHIVDLPCPLHAIHLARKYAIHASRALIALYPHPVYDGLLVASDEETVLRSIYVETRIRALTRWFQVFRIIRLLHCVISAWKI